jgi:hypothetical protein
MLGLSQTAFVAVFALVTACGSNAGNAVDAGPEGEPCGTEICEVGEMCLDNVCVAECSDVANLCGVSSEFCCTTDEACLQDSCVPLGGECEFTEDCEIGEICEPTLMRCIPRDVVEVCEYVPPPGVLDPEVACRWSPPAGDPFAAMEEVVMTPTVMNLTDDNADGETNTQDIPDLVFTSFDRSANGCCTPNGVLRIVSGACEPDGSMRTIATLGAGDPFIDNSGGIALGNLHPASNTAESAPEIVATMRVGAVAFRRTAADGSTWEEMWRNETLPSAAHSDRGGAQPSLADLDGDGAPEVIIGNLVLNGQTGAKLWDGLETVGPTAGIGNNAFLGPVSTVADLDRDGSPEVIAGNTVYNGVTGAEVWSYDYGTANTDCFVGALPCDGYNAIGDFDADDEGEVVIVRSGEVFVLNHDGSLLHQVLLPRIDCGNNESGPPTVADFDGDGRAEIGTAGADYYIVVDFDCTGDPLPAECDSENILWKVANEDCSSRATGSSVFDFEGDGSAEVVYADEISFRVFSGADGTVIYQDDTHLSNTRLEMPIVVDVDNDGKSEIVVPEPNHTNGNLGGIEIWEDAANNWVRTRRVWNQHAYHVTNISETGQVPAQEEANWLHSRLNNFRQNVQPDGLFDAPDLLVSIVLGVCMATAEQEVEVTVTNQGALGVAAGIDVFVQIFDGTTLVDAGVVQTTGPILPGQSEVLFYSFVPPAATVQVHASVDDDGLGGSQYNECFEDNNEADGEFTPCGID